MSGIEKEPLTSVITKHVNATSGTTMITRAPWPNGQYYRLRKLEVTTVDGGLSGWHWRFWDQDLSSTTTAAQGSATSSLIYVGAPVSGNTLFSGLVPITVTRSFDQQARIPFYAGVTMLTHLPTSVTLELEIV